MLTDSLITMVEELEPMGSGDGSMVTPYSTGLVIEKLWTLVQAEEVSSPRSTFCIDTYIGIYSTPIVTAVAHKRSRSFCQKSR